MLIMHTMLNYVYTQSLLKYPQGSQKLCNLRILSVFNHDISHSVVISTIYAGRI